MSYKIVKKEEILLNSQFLKSKFSRKRKFDRKEIYVLDVFLRKLSPFLIVVRSVYGYLVVLF